MVENRNMVQRKWQEKRTETGELQNGGAVPRRSANHSPPVDLKQDPHEGLQSVCGVYGVKKTPV